MCLVGLIAVMLICGICLYVKNIREQKMPLEGTLVKNVEDIGDETVLWV